MFMSSSTMTYIRPLTGSRFDRTSWDTWRSTPGNSAGMASGISTNENADNLLPLPIVEQFEIVGGESDDDVALFVGDGSVDLDEVDFGLEGRLRTLWASRATTSTSSDTAQIDRDSNLYAHSALGRCPYFHASMTFRWSDAGPNSSSSMLTPPGAEATAIREPVRGLSDGALTSTPRCLNCSMAESRCSTSRPKCGHPTGRPAWPASPRQTYRG